MTELNTSNINRLWADLLVEELLRSGAGVFCLAPGSRSTPLTTAVAAHPRADHVMHFDERGTAFFALGYARATRRPAVWITTSGTAVANGYPAAAEAATDGVPLILLTADRPPELRETGANQTIDQVKLFGNYARWQFDLPAPDLAVDPAMVLTTADQAVFRSRRGSAGPVHLNAMFREPLSPDEDGVDYTDYLSPLDRWRHARRPYTSYASHRPSVDSAEVHALGAALRSAEHGLVVAGRLGSKAQADSVRWLSEALKWPLLPDAVSQLRLSRDASTSVPYYDLALASETFADAHRPDAVLYFGSRSTSKRLNLFLAESRPELFAVVKEGPSRLDPSHRVTHSFEADVVEFCETLLRISQDEAGGNAPWLESWQNASGRVESALERCLGDELSEPRAARLVSRLVREDDGLVLASSMPIRDVDMFGDDTAVGPFVAANRGASGIDGTVATAAGFAHGLRRPVTLLIGDLALLHDLNSLSLLGRSAAPVTVVVVNNHGGGIFSFLPIARHADVFEPYFGTPHEYSFEHAAAQFGLPYRHVSTSEELTKAYRAGREDAISQIVEITTDRAENVSLHRRVEDVVKRVLS